MFFMIGIQMIPMPTMNITKSLTKKDRSNQIRSIFFVVSKLPSDNHELFIGGVSSKLFIDIDGEESSRAVEYGR